MAISGQAIASRVAVAMTSATLENSFDEMGPWTFSGFQIIVVLIGQYPINQFLTIFLI